MKLQIILALLMAFAPLASVALHFTGLVKNVTILTFGGIIIIAGLFTGFKMLEKNTVDELDEFLPTTDDEG